MSFLNQYIIIGPVPPGGTYVRQRTSSFDCTVFNEKKKRACFYPDRVLETHGDYNCVDNDGGLNCRLEKFPEGYGKFIDSTLGLEGELNDVRAAGSEPLVWYWEIGIRWLPADENLKATSLHNFAGPGILQPSIQRSLLVTFPVPTAYESIFWYTGRLIHSGELLRLKIHSHNSLFTEALIFAASPEELGLEDQSLFKKQLPHIPDRMNHSITKDFLLRRLSESQIRFEKSKPRKKLTNNCGYPNRPCVQSRPFLACQFHGSFVVRDNFAYDRRQPSCCVPWKFNSGQPFTVIGFNRHIGFPEGPNNPDIRNLPATLPGHVGLWMSFAADDSNLSNPVSHYGYSLYNHYEDGGLRSIQDMLLYQRIATGVNEYTSPHWTNFLLVPNSIPAILIAFSLQNIVGILIFLIILMISVCLLQAHKCNKNRHRSIEINSTSKLIGLKAKITATVTEDDCQVQVPFLLDNDERGIFRGNKCSKEDFEEQAKTR